MMCNAYNEVKNRFDLVVLSLQVNNSDFGLEDELLYIVRGNNELQNHIEEPLPQPS